MLVQLLLLARGAVVLPSPGSMPRWATMARLRAVQMLMLVQMLLLARGLVVLPSPRSVPRFFYFQLLVVLWMPLKGLTMFSEICWISGKQSTLQRTCPAGASNSALP